jgi:hypothetical protein
MEEIKHGGACMNRIMSNCEGGGENTYVRGRINEVKLDAADTLMSDYISHHVKRDDLG